MTDPATETAEGAQDAAPGCPAVEHDIAADLPRCLNCRRAVEASLSRISGRKLRKARALPECSVDRCVRFLNGIEDESMRLHLASMAWWRFSADSDGSADPLLRIMRGIQADIPQTGVDYVHRALRALSPLTPLQLSIWFGCENLYQVVSAFASDRGPMIGEHCSKCGLYKQGCTSYDSLGADTCPFWGDGFVQSVAKTVSKAGGWRNPCANMV